MGRGSSAYTPRDTVGGGARPGTPSSPAGPAAGGPRSPQPGGIGSPLGPATGGPRTPLSPGGPQGASTPGLAAVRADPADWQTWWRFNSESFIDLKTLVGGLDRSTGGDPAAVSQRVLTQARIEKDVVPALWSVLQSGTDTALMRSALLALARVEANWSVPAGMDCTHQAALTMLAVDHRETAEAAVLALGVAGKADSVATLSDLLLDTARGRELVKAANVDFRRRSFAAYALALIGRSATDDALRKPIARALMENLRGGATAPYDVQLACLVSLGLVPLDAHGDSVAAEHDAEHLCRGEQLSFLLAYLQDERRHPQLRAQAVIPLARLAQGAPDADFDAIRDALVEPLGVRSKAPLEVQQSCVIGLGLLGDGDEDELDRAVRSTLMRVAASADRLSKSLALISLAKVAARPGKGANSGKARAEVQEFLLAKLARGDDTARAWSALALGVYGCGLADAGRPADAEIAQALRISLASAKSKEEVGAQCIGLGLLRDPSSSAALVERLEKSKDDLTRACAALATGLVGTELANEPLRKLLASGPGSGALYVSAAIALRLTGARDVALELAGRATSKPADDSTDDVTRLLGHIGDPRTLDELCKLASDATSKPEVRAAAAEALGELCDTRPRHWTAALSTDLHYGLLSSTLLSFSGDGSGALEMR